MFEDEMTEEHMVRTAEEYYRVTEQEKHEEKLAEARAYIAALEGLIGCLKYQAILRVRADLT